MADIAKVKRNVAKMVEMGAPETEIDSYIQEEGTSVDEVRAFKPTQAAAAPSSFMIDEINNNVQNPSLGGNIVNKLMAAKEGIKQGVSFGLADEIDAGINSPIEALLSGKSIPDSYRELRDKNRAELDAITKASPKTAGVYEFAGSMMNPVKAANSVGGRIAQSVGQGALYGYGKSDKERVGDQLEEAAISGATSGALSLGIEGLSKGVGKLYRSITGAAADDLSKAEGFVVGKLKEAGKSDDEIVAIIKEAGEGGVPRTVAEISDSPDLLAAQKRFTQDPGAPNAVMKEFNQERLQRTIPKTIEKFTQDISPYTSPDAAGMAAREAAGDIVSKAKQQRKVLAEPLYESSKTALVPEEQFAALQGDDILGDFIKNTRKDKLFNARVKDLPDNSVGYLNQVKKKIDSQIGVLKNKGDLERASILMDTKKSLVDSLSQASPEYQKALDTFSGESTKIKGVTDTVIGTLSDLRAGDLPKAVDKVFNQTPQQIIKTKALIRKQNPEAWNQLLASHLSNTFDKSRNVEGFIKALDDTPKLQKQVAAAFPSVQQRRDFNLLINHLREATKIKMGSDTVSNAAAGDMLTNELGSQFIQKLENTGSIKAGVFSTARDFVGRINKSIEMGNSEQVAKILTGKDGQALAKKLAGKKPGSPQAIEEIAKFVRNRTPVAATGAIMENGQ